MKTHISIDTMVALFSRTNVLVLTIDIIVSTCPCMHDFDFLSHFLDMFVLGWNSGNIFCVILLELYFIDSTYIVFYTGCIKKKVIELQRAIVSELLCV